MSLANQIIGDLNVRGNISSQTLTIPNVTVTDAMVAAAADIAATKLEHQYEKEYAQESATAAADESRVIHVVHGTTATLISFKVGSVAVAVGNSTVTVDLKKNGTTMLTGVITLDTANTVRVVEEASLSVTAMVAGDVLEVVIDATIGTGTLPKGVFCEAVIREDAI